MHASTRPRQEQGSTHGTNCTGTAVEKHAAGLQHIASKRQRPLGQDSNMNRFATRQATQHVQAQRGEMRRSCNARVNKRASTEIIAHMARIVQHSYESTHIEAATRSAQQRPLGRISYMLAP